MAPRGWQPDRWNWAMHVPRRSLGINCINPPSKSFCSEPTALELLMPSWHCVSISSSCRVTVPAQRLPCHIVACFPWLCVQGVFHCSLQHLCSYTTPGTAYSHTSVLTKTSQTPPGDILGVCSAFGSVFEGGFLIPDSAPCKVPSRIPTSTQRLACSWGTLLPAVPTVPLPPNKVPQQDKCTRHRFGFPRAPRQALLTISTLFLIQMREPQKNVILEAE